MAEKPLEKHQVTLGRPVEDCSVTAQATPNNTVEVAAGTVMLYDGVTPYAFVAATSGAFAFVTAPAVDRWDVLCLDLTNAPPLYPTLTIVQGSENSMTVSNWWEGIPEIPLGYTPLAAVHITAVGVAAVIDSEDIADIRGFIGAMRAEDVATQTINANGFTITHNDRLTVYVTAVGAITSDGTTVIAAPARTGNIGQRLNIVVVSNSSRLTLSGTNLVSRGSWSAFGAPNILVVEWSGTAWKEVQRTSYSNVTMSGANAYAEGRDTVSSSFYSHAEGYGSIASGAESHAEGYDTEISGDYGHVEGRDNLVSGNGSHAEGRSNTTSGDYAHGEGVNTTASGDQSHAEGSGTTASQSSAHSEGLNSAASGSASHAEGSFTTASAQYSHAEGQTTEAAAANAHAEGANTKAHGSSSHAEGSSTKSDGNATHSEGIDTYASGNASHAEGNSSNVPGSGTPGATALEAGGIASHAEGFDTYALGNYSHAEGQTSTASGVASSTRGKDANAHQDYMVAHAGTKYAAQGDAQYTRLVKREVSLGAVVTSTLTYPVPVNTTAALTITLCGRETAGAAVCMVKRMVVGSRIDAGAPALSAVQTIGVDINAAEYAITVNVVGNSVSVWAVGGLGLNVLWTAVFEGAEATF